MTLYINTDGGSKGNPGPASIGVVFGDGQSILHTYREDIGIASNNVAEYTALLRALQIFLTESSSLFPSTSELICRADSELMVKQMRREYKVKHPDMKVLFDSAQALVAEIALPISFVHVPREENSLADALVNDEYSK